MNNITIDDFKTKVFPSLSLNERMRVVAEMRRDIEENDSFYTDMDKDQKLKFHHLIEWAEAEILVSLAKLNQGFDVVSKFLKGEEVNLSGAE